MMKSMQVLNLVRCGMTAWFLCHQYHRCNDVHTKFNNTDKKATRVEDAINWMTV
jgi:hypothetical protein